MFNNFRRIKRIKSSKLQSYQIFLIALVLEIFFTLICYFVNHFIKAIPFLLSLSYKIEKFTYCLLFLIVINIILLVIFFNKREEVATLSVKKMTSKSYKISKNIKQLFNDKQITDILKLSNRTRYGEEMPNIYVYVADNQEEGYIAIENIANYERADRDKFEQRVSGILAGKYQRFAIVSSKLTIDDNFIKFYFEDTTSSHQLIVKDNIDSLKEFISQDNHAIRLSKDLIWHSDITPHFSIIARTRAGKSVFAGRYLARMMLSQNWIVEYNSAKYDRYVKEFNGQSEAVKIVERAEYWCTVMDERLTKINEANKEKYLEMENMQDIGLFFDEIGNLNAALESLDKVDKSLKITSRWTTAINRLSATGASAGIHIIAISQFATKEGFLPSLARVNCSDAVIMLGGAADSATERQYLLSGFTDMPKRSYGKGQGIAKIVGSGSKWENSPHFFETPWFEQ